MAYDTTINYGKILIVDGSYMLHRSLHVKQVFELQTSRGIRAGAVFNFLRSLDLETARSNGYMPIVVWDAGLAKRRLETIPNYKHQQEKLEDRKLVEQGLKEPDKESDEYVKQYVAQRAMVNSILDVLGVPHIRISGWEGDDIMYILSRMSDDNIVLTDDKDLIQLLTPHTRIGRPMHGDILDYESYQQEHNDPEMRRFIMSKALVGDGSDNIPGVAKGLGGKAAEDIAKVISENPSNWNEILAQPDQKKGLAAPKIVNWAKANEKNLNEWMTWKDEFTKEDPETGKSKTLPPYLGFLSNVDQFKKNVIMTDLTLVDNEITDEILNEIANNIINGLVTPDYMAFMAMASKYEFTKLDTQGIIMRMTTTISNYKQVHGLV